jgi:DNA-directed RNA polymerase subunit N (RpoN/RPB10)
MYTGTLIKDLMATVERVERGAQPKQIVDDWTVDEMELRRMFGTQLPLIHDERVYAGAA